MHWECFDKPAAVMHNEWAFIGCTRVAFKRIPKLALRGTLTGAEFACTGYSILAIFPDIPADMNGNLLDYMTIGQHGACCPKYAEKLDDATPDEYAPLLAELENIGYNDLVV